jgi:serpin B
MDFIKYLVACTFALSSALFGLIPEHEVEHHASQENKPSFPLPAKQVSKGNKQFAFELYHSLPDKDLNCAISPYSLSSCMGMISMIAEDETLEEIQKVMHFPKYPLMLDFGFRWINESLTSGVAIGSEPVHLTPTNAIWTQKGVIISPALLTKVAHFWDGIHQADFKHESEASRLLINSYVKEKTLGKIIDFIPEGLIDPETRMVAINTLYFSAPWKKPFQEHQTREKLFYGLEKDLPIPFMHKQEVLNVGQFDLFSIVEIPFADSLSTNSAISLYLILPQGTLSELESVLDDKAFRKAVKRMDEKFVDLHVPRFELETNLSLRPTLLKMGLLLPFVPGEGFPCADEEGGRLVLTDVIQTVKFELNEWGSTCAAATGGIIGLTSFPSTQESIDFNCNHPFLFVIADKTTDTILFMGHFVQPN